MLEAPDHPNDRLRVLLISGTFPPRGGSSVQRVAKYCKYATRQGDQVTVVTTSYAGRIVDDSLMANVPPQVQVRRVGSDPNTYGPVKRRLARAAYPDSYFAWGRAAYREGARLLTAHEFDVIKVSFGQPSALITAARLARRFNKPLLLDIRDMWTAGIKPSKRNRQGTLRGRLDRIVEAACWKQVDHFTVVSGGYKEIMIDRYGVEAGRVDVIYNGFDGEDLPPPTNSTGDAFVVRYTGFVSDMPTLKAAVDGIEAVRNRSDDPIARSMTLEIVGDNSATAIASGIGRTTLPEWIRFQPYVPHAEAVGLMRSAGLLLMSQPFDHGMLTGKFFEYAGSGTPILHIDNGTEELASLIRGYRLGLSARVDSPADIIRAIEKVVSGRFNRAPSAPPSFTREHQAAQFGAALRCAITHRISRTGTA